MIAHQPRRSGCVRLINGISRVLLLLTATLAGGCNGSKGLERVVVSGTVSYKNKPLSEGIIRFVPIPTCPGPTTGGTIIDGKFRVDAKGGVQVGTHTIQIEAYRIPRFVSTPGVPDPPYVPKGVGAREQWLPATYNKNTELEITIESGSQEITKNFDLTD